MDPASKEEDHFFGCARLQHAAAISLLAQSAPEVVTAASASRIAS
jgi:hypothetical protein